MTPIIALHGTTSGGWLDAGSPTAPRRLPRLAWSMGLAVLVAVIIGTINVGEA